MSSRRQLIVDVQVATSASSLPSQAQLENWVHAVLDAVDEVSQETELAVRIVDADEGRTLNRQYRQRDRPTNVLSFPFTAMDGLPEGETKVLGDLVLCAPIVASEALEQGKRELDHWAHLVTHGTLHLLGYDHAEVREAAAMEALETQILRSFGIENPY